PRKTRSPSAKKGDKEGLTRLARGRRKKQEPLQPEPQENVAVQERPVDEAPPVADRVAAEVTGAPQPEVLSEAVPAQPTSTRGVLELHPKGYGFLRDLQNDYR